MKENTTREALERRVAELEAELQELKTANREQLENGEKYRRLFLDAPIGIVTVSQNGHVTSANPFFCKLLGYTRNELLQKRIIDITHPADMARERVIIKKMLNNGLAKVQFAKRYKKKNGEIVWAELVTSSLWDKEMNKSFGLGMVIDISDRRMVEEERNKLIEELKEALSQVKILKGLLPLCTYCKKIRDDAGNWNPVDAYIKKHSEAEISHGICPECARKHYPDFELYDD